MRRVFIGDVQGCADALRRLLDKVGISSSDQVVFTGDLVNKGPDNVAVLRLAREIGAESVLGNHDVLLLEVAAGRVRKHTHTLHDVLIADDQATLLAWLHARPILHTWPDLAVVHAAIRPGWDDLQAWSVRLRHRFEVLWDAGKSPFEDPDVRFALSARYTDRSGEQATPDYPPPGPPYVNWADLYSGAPTVVFGHFARQGLLIRPRLRGLDTGCVYGKELSAWIAEEDRIVSVPATV